MHPSLSPFTGFAEADSPVCRDEQQLPWLQHYSEAPDITQPGPCIRVRAVQRGHCIAVVGVVNGEGVHAMVGMLRPNQQDAPAPIHLHIT